jgi:uncharacterized integral membrane protein
MTNMLQILGKAVSELNQTDYNVSNLTAIEYQHAPAFASGAFATVLAIWLIVIVAMILLFILWIFMIVDVSKRKFKTESDKIGWILIIVLTGYIGAIVYYFAVKRPDKH